MSMRLKLTWLTLDRGIRLLVSLANGALIARALGPTDFGGLSQALLLYSVIDTIAALGLPGVLNARIAVASITQRRQIIIRALLLRFMAAIFLVSSCYFILGSIDINWFGDVLLSILMLGLLISNWSISDAYLQGVNFPERGALSKSLVAILMLLIRLLYIKMEASTQEGFALLFVLEQVLLSLVLLWAVFKLEKTQKSLSGLSGLNSTKIMSHALIMWSSQIVTLIYMRVDQAILSGLASRAEFADYIIASQLAELTFTLPVLINSLYIGRVGDLIRNSNQKSIDDAMVIIYRKGFSVALLISISAAIFSPLVIPFVYGEEYSNSIVIFCILIFALPFVTLGTLQNMTIFTGNNPEIQIKKTFFAALVGVPISLSCWYIFGVLGLAFSALFLQIISCWLINYFVDLNAFNCQNKSIIFFEK